MQPEKKILLTGASGFIGGRLLRELAARGLAINCLIRSPEKLEGKLPAGKITVYRGDLLQEQSLAPSFSGVGVAYYLVHSMTGGKKGFAERDRQAAINFAQAAGRAGIERIIYMSGLGEKEDRLSRHLASRREVADILASSGVPVTVLRAATIIGAGGAPFEMIRYLVERLPAMVCPLWVFTRSQPISVHNAVEYLAGCLDCPQTAGGTFDIGGPDIVTYIELMRAYAKVRNRHPLIIPVPVLTPRLSAYWVDLITPVPSGIVQSLIEGLKNEAVCHEHRIRGLIPLRLHSMQEAICTALVESPGGPGKLASSAQCELDAGKRGQT